MHLTPVSSLCINLALASLVVPVSGVSTAAAQTVMATNFPARIVAAHNLARRDAGMAALNWDQNLAQGAAMHAAMMAATGSFAHSSRKARPGVGENLWMGTNGRFTIESMIGSWVSERRQFVPGIFPANSRTGNWVHIAHYTQIIWPTTTHVGCALASGRGQDFLVCRYSPKGNIDGRPVPFALSR
jgi:hypothetical protein